jgi:CTP synthase
VYEALDHAGIALHTRVVIRKVESEEVQRDGAERVLSGVDGVLVPGGFGYRGIGGKIEAIRFARERQVPFFGICLGLQCAVIEFARNVAGLEDANSTEMDANCRHPVVCLLDEQYDITNLGGTMRVGSYPCVLTAGSRAAAAYGDLQVHERHRHRYEFNNQYRYQFEAHGLAVTGTSPGGELVEVLEIPEHPWFVAVQCHPEFKSKPTRAHPLFRGFVAASLARREAKKAEAARARGVVTTAS